MKSRSLYLLGALLVLIVAGGAAYLTLMPTLTIPSNPAVAEPAVPGDAATSTPVVSNDELPPEPMFVLPDGARVISDYFFVVDDQVYMRSVKSPEPIAIPDTDAATFKSLGAFKQYTGGTIRADCGGAGDYMFYGDQRHLYFHQVWRTPTFRASQIEVVVGSNAARFEALSNQSFTDGRNTFTLAYRKATSTCSYYLQKNVSE